MMLWLTESQIGGGMGRRKTYHGTAKREMMAFPQSVGVMVQFTLVHSSESVPANMVGPFWDEKDQPMYGICSSSAFA